VRLPWLAHDEAPGPYITIPQYWFNKTKQHTLVWCKMRLLCWEWVMCERKAKKDVPAAVVCRAACISRALPDDASRPALAGWGRPALYLRVNFLRPC